MGKMAPIVFVTPRQFFNCIDEYLTPEDRLRVHQAFEFARRKHGNQRRKSGELFFVHPLTVTYYLAEYHLDADALSAALLHDVAEDTSVSIAEIEARFGPEVAYIVDGVTKLKDVTEGVSKDAQLSKEEIQDLSNQKMLREMTQDVRVVLVKLFDRLHNMRTIQHTPYLSQVRKARETLSVFAPLANRLGIWKIKSELEALSLAVLDLDAYAILHNSLKQLHEEQQEMYHLVSGQIFEHLLEANLDVRKVALAPESIFSVYQDLRSSGLGYADVDRTLRMVVLLQDWVSCYTALGYLHQLWRAVPDRFDDYISVPRDNLYRSLHTTVIHASGDYLKIRLRTVAMDRVSQIGVLARWRYADTPYWDEEIASRVEALFENIKGNIDADHLDAGETVKSVLVDQLSKQIRVNTPRGDAIELAYGSTPIDFAYAIHTGLGDQCRAAYVNENLYPLNKPLRNGDRVRIEKGAAAQPQREWLDEDLGYLATNYARSHARRWFRRLPQETAVAEGKQLLESELLMLGQCKHSHYSLARSFDFDTPEELYYALGRAELMGAVVATRVLDETWADEPLRGLDNVVVGPSGEKYVITNADGRELRLCATCEPRPRDSIVGYIRKNGQVTVHKEGCHSLRANHKHSRLLKLGWGAATPREARILTIMIDVYDRPGLMYDITNLMRQENVNIPYIHTPPTPRMGEVRIILSLEVERPRQAVRLLHRIQALVNVHTVRCLPNDQVGDGNGRSFYKPE